MNKPSLHETTNNKKNACSPTFYIDQMRLLKCLLECVSCVAVVVVVAAAGVVVVVVVVVLVIVTLRSSSSSSC